MAGRDVTVTGGEVAAVEGLDHRSTSYLETWGTDDVPSLHDLIEDAARAEASPTGAATITRAEGGRPERIEIDPVTSGIDDEACYEIEAYDPASRPLVSGCRPGPPRSAAADV